MALMASAAGYRPLGRPQGGCGRRAARQRGFTIAEILIVVAVVGVLAAIGIPSYQNYVRKAARAEAKAALADISAREEQFNLNNRAYTATLVGTAGLNLLAVTKGGYWTLALYAPGAAPAAPASACVAPAGGWLAVATPVAGSISARDLPCTAFCLNSAGTKTAYTSTATATTTCW
jgi:type IV pilus assembly protein PilE